MNDAMIVEPVIHQEVTPMVLVQQAMTAGAGVDQLERLLDMQIKWEQNEARKAYHAAIAGFKESNIRIIKDARVAFGNTNYTHATLGNIVEQVTPALSKNGLSHSWCIKQHDKLITVVCTVSHIDGHAESVEITGEPDKSGSKNTIQQTASTITYLQRYSLLSALGLATADDDGRSSEPEQTVIDDDQLGNLEALADELGVDEAQFCKFFKVSALHMIPQSRYEAAVKNMEAKRGRK